MVSRILSGLLWDYRYWPSEGCGGMLTFRSHISGNQIHLHFPYTQGWFSSIFQWLLTHLPLQCFVQDYSQNHCESYRAYSLCQYLIWTIFVPAKPKNSWSHWYCWGKNQIHEIEGSKRSHSQNWPLQGLWPGQINLSKNASHSSRFPYNLHSMDHVMYLLCLFLWTYQWVCLHFSPCWEGT